MENVSNNNDKSLKSIFFSGKDKLANELAGLILSRDAQQVQKIVAEHLGKLLENDNVFRQNLTESEDYILLAALRILQAQQDIAVEIAKSAKTAHTYQGNNESSATQTNPYYSVIGAGVGALAGGLLGTWVAVAGAIAGAAVAIYCTPKSLSAGRHNSEEIAQTGSPINADVFIGVVENICESIDDVLETYRVQVKKITNSYEQKEAPSLQKDYATLLERVVNVHNTSKSMSETVPQQLTVVIDMLANSLENYGLKIENGKIVKC